MRTGLLTKKLGMSRVFTDEGRSVPVTLLQLDNCQVVGQKTQARDGYTAVQIGYGSRKVKNISKSERTKYAKAKIEPKARVVEFRVSEDALLNVGDQLSAAHFVAGQKVDVSAVNKGKGFQGGMKRHNFKGLEATHGISISHRSHGSTGQCQEPGRVFKGKKMAGHMGDVRTTTQNLEVIVIDEAEGVIAVKGAVPGAKGSFVEVRDAVKKATELELPFPAALIGANDASPAAAEEAPSEEAAQAEAPAAEEAPVEAEAAPAEETQEEAKAEETAEATEEEKKDES